MQDSLKHKTAKGAAWISAMNLCALAVSFTSFIVLARLLSPAAFGIIAAAQVIINLFAIFQRFGLPEALAQRSELGKGHINAAFWISALLGCLLFASGWSFSGLAAAFFNMPDLTSPLRVMLFALILNIFCIVPLGLLKRDFKFKEISVAQLVSLAAGSVIGITMAIMGFGVWSLVAMGLVNVFITALTFTYMVRYYPRLNFSLQDVKAMFSFGIHVVGADSINSSNSITDKFVVGRFIGDIALGYYYIAQRLIDILNMLIIQPVSEVILPGFSKIQKNPDEALYHYYKIIRLSAFIAFPVFIGVSLMAPEIVKVFLQSKWVPAIAAMQIYALIGPSKIQNAINMQLLIAFGKPNRCLWNSAINATVNIAGFLLVFKWGIEAIAAVLVIRSYILSPLLVIMLKNVTGLSMAKYYRQNLYPITAIILMCISVFITKRLIHDFGSGVTLVLCPIVGAFVYCVTVLLLHPKLMSGLIDEFRRKETRVKMYALTVFRHL